MRLDSATIAFAPGIATTDPDAVRIGEVGTARRLASTVPVLEFHSPVLDSHHRAHVAGLRILDDHSDLDGNLGGPGFPMGIVGKDIGAIAINHRVIVGSHPCC